MSQEAVQYDKVQAQEKWQAFWEEDETFILLTMAAEAALRPDMFPPSVGRPAHGPCRGLRDG